MRLSCSPSTSYHKHNSSAIAPAALKGHAPLCTGCVPILRTITAFQRQRARWPAQTPARVLQASSHEEHVVHADDIAEASCSSTLSTTPASELSQSQRSQSQARWSPASVGLARQVQNSWLLSVSALAGVSGFLGGFGADFRSTGSTAAAIAVMAAIVAVHEAGHFMAARLQGIRVTKFCIGFGPALYTYTAPDGVEYSLNLFPLGGFVAFPEDPARSELLQPPPGAGLPAATKSPAKVKAPVKAASAKAGAWAYDAKDPNLLENRSILQRAIVISAGVTANVVFALAVLFLQVTTVGKAETAFLPGVQVPRVTEDSPAQRAGLRNGDIIVSAGGQTVPAEFNQVRSVVNTIGVSAGRPLALTVEREGARYQMVVYPEATSSDGRGKIGAELASNVFINHTRATGLVDAVAMTGAEFNRLAGSVISGLQSLVTNFSSMANQLSGPVAIVVAGSKIARTDSAGLFQFCALVNINLAIVNVLPLPALDGGYLLLLLVEGLRNGKKLPTELEETVTASGVLLLFVIGVGLVVRDTINLF